jgi:hypothetical protein
MAWKINYIKKPLKSYPNSNLIVGLPGMANIGKISADYLVNELKPKLLATLTSDNSPAFSLISEDNLVVLPKIEIYHKKINKNHFFFVVGDYQPVSDLHSFELSKKIVEFAEKHKIKKLFTLGGIGLEEEPEKPKIFATANNKKFLEWLKDNKFKTDVYMKVGVIIGVTGLVISLSKIDAAALLVQTSSAKGHIGLNSAKQLLKSLKKLFGFDFNFRNLNKEIKAIEKLAEELLSLQKDKGLKKGDVNYIG